MASNYGCKYSRVYDVLKLLTFYHPVIGYQGEIMVLTSLLKSMGKEIMRS